MRKKSYVNLQFLKFGLSLGWYQGEESVGIGINLFKLCAGWDFIEIFRFQVLKFLISFYWEN